MFVCEAVAQQWLLYIYLSHSHCPATIFFAKLLHSSGSCIFAYLTVIAQQRVYVLKYYSNQYMMLKDWTVIQ
jgi:hypothetical protein